MIKRTGFLLVLWCCIGLLAGAQIVLYDANDEVVDNPSVEIISLSARSLPMSRQSKVLITKIKPTATRFAGEQALGMTGDIDPIAGKDGPSVLLWLRQPISLAGIMPSSRFSVTVVSRMYPTLQLSLLLDGGKGELRTLRLGDLGFDSWKTLVSPPLSDILRKDDGTDWTLAALSITYTNDQTVGWPVMKGFDNWVLYLKQITLN